MKGCWVGGWGGRVNKWGIDHVDKSASCDNVGFSMFEKCKSSSTGTVQPKDHGEEGVSWLELFTLFMIQGYGTSALGTRNKATVKDSLRSQLKNFKNVVRTIVGHTCEDGDKHLFWHSRSKMRLLPTTHVPTFQIEIPQDIQWRVASEIIRSLGKRRTYDLLKILEGKILIIEGKIKTVGRAGWAQGIKRQRNTSAIQHGNQTEELRGAVAETSSSYTFTLSTFVTWGGRPDVPRARQTGQLRNGSANA